MEQPILNIVTSFDANYQKRFEYTYLGSEQILTNQLEVRVDRIGSSPVYSGTTTKFDKNHILPEGTLKNGETYKAKIRVQVREGQWSPWSPEITFTTLAKPNFYFETIQDDKFVYNDDVLMRVVYQQPQGDLPEYYNFQLLDESKVPIRTYPQRRPQSNLPTVMEERISGLVKGRLYYVAVTVHTINGITTKGMHEFIPHFVAPSVSSVVNINSDYENGQVVVQSFLRQQLGIQTHPYVKEEGNAPFQYAFVNNEWVVIPAFSPLEYRKLGVGKSSDFVLKVWCKNVSNGTFMSFATEDGGGIGIELIKEDDRIIAKKKYLNEDNMGVISRHKSNEVPNIGKREFYLYVLVKEFRVELYIEVI